MTAPADSSSSASATITHAGFHKYQELPEELQFKVLERAQPSDYSMLRLVNRRFREIIDEVSLKGKSYRRYLIRHFRFIQKPILVNHLVFQLCSNEEARRYSSAVTAFVERRIREILAPIFEQVLGNLQHTLFSERKIDNSTLLKMVIYWKDPKVVAAQAVLTPMLASAMDNVMGEKLRDRAIQTQLQAIHVEAIEMEKKEEKGSETE